MPRRQKKDLPMNVPANPSTDARTTEVYVSIKFHSSTSEARDSLRAVIMPESKIIHRFFSISCCHWGGTVISLQNHNIFRSLNWIQWVPPPSPQYQCWYKHKREKSNAPVCDQSKEASRLQQHPILKFQGQGDTHRVKVKSKASGQTTDAVVAEWQTACETHGHAILSQTLWSVLTLLSNISKPSTRREKTQEKHVGCQYF